MSNANSEDEAYFEKTRELLESAYLAADDPRAGSGFRGDEARWERARRPISAAIHRDGTFLDIGCANGLLMESVKRWAAENGFRIEPHGLDLIPSLADHARKRLPRYADHIHTGNVMEWTPPRRFDFIRTELEYAPPKRRRSMVEKLLRDFAAPGGRIIICSYGSSRKPSPKAEPVADILRRWNHEVAGESEAADKNGVVITRIAWIEAA